MRRGRYQLMSLSAVRVAKGSRNGTRCASANKRVFVKGRLGEVR